MAFVIWKPVKQALSAHNKITSLISHTQVTMKTFGHFIKNRPRFWHSLPCQIVFEGLKTQIRASNFLDAPKSEWDIKYRSSVFRSPPCPQSQDTAWLRQGWND